MAFDNLLSVSEVSAQLKKSVAEVKIGPRMASLRRTLNEGMDFAAHNVRIRPSIALLLSAEVEHSAKRCR